MNSDYEDYSASQGRQSRRSNNQVEIIWKRLPMQNVYHTISTYCREKHLHTIRDTLLAIDGEICESFEKSCFGYFLKLPENVVKCNQVMHYVISREIIVEGGDDSKMWFRINDVNLRFSRFEYALVTGLRFGASSFNPNEPHEIDDDSFYSWVPKKKSITMSDLWDRFERKKLGRNKEDYLKVAKVYLVYFEIFGYDSSKVIVAEWLWVLVEDKRA